MKEKSLIKREKSNIFRIIKAFFKNLFYKKPKIEYENMSREISNKNMISELEKENKVLTLQRKYENGNIREEDLSENEKEELLLLYKKQIKNLEENISNYQKELEICKIKIIEKREKLLKNN